MGKALAVAPVVDMIAKRVVIRVMVTDEILVQRKLVYTGCSC